MRRFGACCARRPARRGASPPLPEGGSNGKSLTAARCSNRCAPSYAVTAPCNESGGRHPPKKSGNDGRGQQLSVAQPKGLGRARASVSEPLRAYAIGKIATGKLRAGPAHGIPVAILPGPEACGLETAGLLLISSCLINRLALEACASLATRNACSGVLGRLRPNPGRRQASVTPAPRLRSWLAS